MIKHTDECAVHEPTLRPCSCGLETRLTVRIKGLESVLSELWALHCQRVSCSQMTAQQRSEHAARMDAAWQEVERMVGETLKEPS